MKKLLVLSIAAMAVSAYAAETYTVQAGVQHQTESTDDKTDLTATTFAGTYYLKPITIDGNQPFMELDVLQRASGVTVRYANVSMETSTLNKTTLSPVEFSGNFFVNDFVLGFNNSTWDKNFTLKSDATKYYGIKSTTTGFNVGYWVTPTTVVSYVNEKNDASYTRSVNSLSAIADVTNTTNGVLSHSVISLGGTQSVVLDLGYKQVKREQTTSKTNTEYAAKVRYYPEAKYFFEGGYSVNSGDYDYNKGKAFMVGAGYAFTPRFAVLLATEKFDGDVAAEKSSGTKTALTAGYRF